MAGVYLHYKEDMMTPFYVGAWFTDGASSKRPYSKQYRSKHWHNTVNKHGIFVKVLKDDITVEEADELEILLISEIGRADLNKGTLVNLTDGGEHGILGHKHSDKTKKKIGDIHRGKKLSDKHINAISKWSKEYHRTHDNPMKGVTGEKHPFYGKKHTEEAKKAISDKNKGNIPPNKGKKGLWKPTKEQLNKMTGRAPHNRLKVEQYNLDGKFINVFNSMREAAKATHTDYYTIKNSSDGITTSRHKFKWNIIKTKK